MWLWREITAQSSSGLLNKPSTIKRVADIPEQHPTTSDDNLHNRIPSFTYSISSDVGVRLQTTNLPTCGSVMQPSTVSYVVNFPGYLDVLYPGCGRLCFAIPPSYHTLTITPASNLDLETRQMSICNPFQDSNCNVCVLNNAGVRSQISVVRGGSEVLVNVQCVLFQVVNCGEHQCPNGKYATTYLKKDANGFVISNTNCLPCKPGTWLTCRDYANCYYDIPTSPGDFDGGEQVYHPPGLDAVGACFSCESAGNKMHYGLTNKKSGIYVSNSNPLPWYCPGGDEPPVLCKPPFIGANSNFTACTCSPGKFIVGGTNACQICPPGFMCYDGLLIECPDDYYQDKSGASECNPCLSDANRPIQCYGSNEKLVMCRGRQKSKRPQCVPCNSCRHDYDTDSAAVNDCY